MTDASISVPVSRTHILTTLSLVGGFTLLGDFLFWKQLPGISVAIFALSIAAILYSLPSAGQRTRASGVATALLIASCGATALELSFTNFAVIVALLAVLMGERHYPDIRVAGARWSESLLAWACAATGWRWLAREFRESELANIGWNTMTTDRAARVIQITAPAISLGIIFGIVLCMGNALFSQLVARFSAAFMEWVASIDYSPWRMILWALFASFAIALVRVRAASSLTRWWIGGLPKFPRACPSVAVWQSIAVFVVLNAMFFVVNTLDVIYLWAGTAETLLPQGVSHSAYVHQGVYSLIVAVLLSAAVIAAIFQQESKVTENRVLKAFAWAWIAQNVVLIAGVFLRLKMYVDVFQLSELRVYVACFLLLVTIGFALLAVHVERGDGLGTLVWRNVLATFALFFVIQFPDVAGFVARYNVAHWKTNPAHGLDVAYLEDLGPAAWPALCEVAFSKLAAEPAKDARQRVTRLASVEAEYDHWQNWRSFQWRRDEQRHQLREASEAISSGAESL